MVLSPSYDEQFDGCLNTGWWSTRRARDDDEDEGREALPRIPGAVRAAHCTQRGVLSSTSSKYPYIALEYDPYLYTTRINSIIARKFL